MKYITTPHFDRELKKFSLEIRRAFYKQMDFLLADIRHPSLRAKKYDESVGVWQARITNNVRIFFLTNGNDYILLNIRKHTD